METPFVVIGMHRSGTSLVSRILDKSGIMMGKDLQTDHESKFFIQLNKWIYQNAGADWARPKALEELIDYAPARKQVEEYLRIRIASSSSKKFSGRNLKNGLFDMDSKWGWKDPRNGPSLPIWKDIWPEMKIIHVVRHGVDVAASLHSRSLKNWTEDEGRFKKWTKMYKWRSSKSPIRKGQRAATLTHALEFWAEQMDVEKKVIQSYENVLEIRYEDLLTSPAVVLKDIWNYIGKETDEELLREIETMVDYSRAFAYKQNEELSVFAQENKSILERFGYSA
ncbi:TPA: sulfotransferase [Candidatus Thalassarchaeaceae archaeon]|nr:sulfotransferase [Euryarchaeota archaeon]MDC0501942.1 sulfotransferase [Euryarchaeota archaeon]MDC3326355.1 sulfotransferase [Euryarchaeota archaeon]DAC68125.1 MAG TPA: sulfotransferase [Candidatus Poseidoniales archaeon]HII41561.1 sulfotransferase [Candidatus Thalassarchaeaceae archaeon]